jgi:DNA-binding NarL/FixJ family response regulator
MTMAKAKRPSAKIDADKLTAREVDVLRRLIHRWSDKEIADGLQVSIHAIKYHKKNIYSKWGVGRRAEAIAVCRSKLKSPTKEFIDLWNSRPYANVE